MSKVFLVRLSRYSIYKVQSLALSRQLAYTSTSCSLCQVLFFKFFQTFLWHSFERFSVAWLPSRTAWIYYHMLSYLSSGIFTFFDIFYQKLYLPSICCKNSGFDPVFQSFKCNFGGCADRYRAACSGSRPFSTIPR